MIYDSAHEPPRSFIAHDDYLPYLTASNCTHGGYRSSPWPDEDRMLVLCAKIAFVAAIGGLICIILMMLGR